MADPKPWEINWGAPQQSRPAPPAFIPGMQSPAKAAAETRANQSQAMDAERLRIAQAAEARAAQNDSLDIQGKRDKLNRAKAGAISASRVVLDQLDAIDKSIRGTGGWGLTGKSGDLMRRWYGSGSDAYDLQAAIKTIDANTAISNLSEMRQNSPTGGAVGNVSDKDMELLKSTVANLDPNQSQNTFIERLNATRKHYVRVLGQLDPKAAGAYLQEFQRRYPQVGGKSSPAANHADDALVAKYLNGGR